MASTFLHPPPTIACTIHPPPESPLSTSSKWGNENARNEPAHSLIIFTTKKMELNWVCSRNVIIFITMLISARIAKLRLTASENLPRIFVICRWTERGLDFGDAHDRSTLITDQDDFWKPLNWGFHDRNNLWMACWLVSKQIFDCGNGCTLCYERMNWGWFERGLSGIGSYIYRQLIYAPY